MELYELTQSFKSVFGISELSDSPKIIMNILIEKNYDVIDKWLEVYPDLSKDYLQPIFQYYMADRKEKMQDYTPPCLGKLCANILDTRNAVSCYDMCAGSGSLTIQIWNLNKNMNFICEELDENVIPFLLLNLAMRNISATVINGNILSGERFKAYKISSSAKYSEVSEIEPPFKFQTDICISNPPYNLKWEPPVFAQLDERFAKYGVPSKSNGNFAFILTAFAISQKAAFILPNSITSEDLTIIKNMVEDNVIDSIIINPNSMFEKTDIGTCVFALDKNKNTRSIEMIDCRSKNFVEVKREQQGQYGGNSHTGRTYTKATNEYTDENISKILDYISERKSQAEFSKAVYFNELREHEFDLTPSLYIKFVPSEIEHRSYSDIAKDLNKVIQSRNALKLVVNEALARRLGLDTNNFQKSDDVLKTIENISKVKIESEDYIQLTKNKNEFALKANSKEIFPEALLLALNLWKQNVMIYNNQENILLAEFRDALIPDLMNRKIEL